MPRGRLYRSKRGEEEEEEASELERLEEEEAKAEAAAVKRMALKKRKLELKRELEELEERQPTANASTSGVAQLVAALVAQGMDAKAASEYVKDLDPEVKAMMMTKVSTGDMSIPLMIALMSRQKTTEGERVSIKDLTSATKDIYEMTGGGKREEKSPSIVDIYERILKPVVDKVDKVAEQLARERMSRLEEKIKELENRPSGLQELMNKKEELMALQSIFGGGTPNFELEKLRLEQQKWRDEKELEWEREKWRDVKESEKWDKVLDRVVEPTLTRAGPIIDAAATEAEKRIRGGSRSVQEVHVPAEAQEYPFKCPGCGFVFPIKPDASGKWPSTIVCPEEQGGCGKTWVDKTLVDRGVSK